MLTINEQAELYMMGVVAHLQTYKVTPTTLESALLSDKLRYSDRCAKYIKSHVIGEYDVVLVNRALEQEHRQHYTPLYALGDESARIIVPSGHLIILIGDTDRRVVELFHHRDTLKLNNMGINSLIYFNPSEVNHE